MKNNSCLLDRLYCTKCYYIPNTPTLHDFLHISCTKKEKGMGGGRKKKRLHKKKLNVPLYENRKYQIKMCTDSLSCLQRTLEGKYKKTYKNDQITHYLEHRGTGAGLVTGQH